MACDRCNGLIDYLTMSIAPNWRIVSFTWECDWCRLTYNVEGDICKKTEMPQFRDLPPKEEEIRKRLIDEMRTGVAGQALFNDGLPLRWKWFAGEEECPPGESRDTCRRFGKNLNVKERNEICTQCRYTYLDRKARGEEE